MKTWLLEAVTELLVDYLYNVIDVNLYDAQQWYLGEDK